MQASAAKCPRCGSKDVLPIIYGLQDPEQDVELRVGRVKLGGCLVGPDSPELYCKACRHEWRTSPA